MTDKKYYYTDVEFSMRGDNFAPYERQCPKCLELLLGSAYNVTMECNHCGFSGMRDEFVWPLGKEGWPIRVDNMQMNFKTYQKISRKTAIYPDQGNNIIYPTLGLAGEAGEVADIIKKSIRDNEGKIDTEIRAKLFLELGDVLWYLSAIATELDTSLEAIAISNCDKLADRRDRDKIGGSGDFR